MRELPTIEGPVPVLNLSSREIEQLTDEIRTLAAKGNAVVLAHNYQVPEIQDLADFVGSLARARRLRPTRS
jgi:quinolinate synthase